VREARKLGLRSLVGALVLATTAFAGGFAFARSLPGRGAEGGRPPELATFMGQLQHHTHKLGLSIEARNPPLADFYLHELVEVAEQVEAEVPEHDGLLVPELVEQMLDPALARLGRSLESGDWAGAHAAFGVLVEACNQCHGVMGHAYLRVSGSTTNPFNQSFAVAAPEAP
jgi:hypothetical protein